MASVHPPSPPFISPPFIRSANDSPADIDYFIAAGADGAVAKGLAAVDMNRQLASILFGHHDLVGAGVGGLDLQLGKNCYSPRVGVDPLRADDDRDVQQATLNLFADMGVRPSTPQPQLHQPTPSTDTSPPTIGRTATRTIPSDGAKLADSWLYTLQGSSEDVGGGVVAAVEVSLDGGASWTPADVDPPSGAWSLEAVPPFGPSEAAGRVPADGEEIRVRAADDSGNLSSESVVRVVSSPKESAAAPHV